jgi:hypothetical protein
VRLPAVPSRRCIAHRGDKWLASVHSAPGWLQADKEALLADIRELTRDIKLKDAVLAAFIPPAYQDLVMRHARWDSRDGSWAVAAMELAGNPLRARRDMAHAQAAHLAAAAAPPAGARLELIACLLTQQRRTCPTHKSCDKACCDLPWSLTRDLACAYDASQTSALVELTKFIARLS